MSAENTTQTLCDFPVIYDMGECCGKTPCAMEWYRPCDADGGCLDRATCGGCDTPVFKEKDHAK